LKVMRDGRLVTVDVTADGAGSVSHAGSALIAQVADKLGLTRALSLRLAGLKQRRRGHDPGRVIRDLAVMLADGGECISDLGAVRDQQALFGPVASDSTAFRVIDRIACEQLLGELRGAHARACERFWELHGAPQRLTIDRDATLITARSEKQRAAGNYKGGFGLFPLQAYLDETREVLGGLLRSGNAGGRTKVMGRFPGETSCLTLVWAVLDLFISHQTNGIRFTELDRQLLNRIRYQEPDKTIHEEVTAAYTDSVTGNLSRREFCSTRGTPPRGSLTTASMSVRGTTRSTNVCRGRAPESEQAPGGARRKQLLHPDSSIEARAVTG
jgi:hypothetical protein